MMALVERILRAARRDWRLVVTFAALWGVSLVPLWLPRFLPLLDLPNHLGAIAIWHRYREAAWGYSKYYDLNLLPLPYWGYFFPVHMLAYLMPIEVANKIYLSAYALALPVGAALLAHRMGRSPWLALFAFPLIFNMNFMFGFITFCAGMAFLFYALFALDRFLERPTGASGAAVALLSIGLYLMHVLPWLFFGVAAMVLLFCHGWHPRRIAAAAALMLPSLLLGIYGFKASANGTTAVVQGPLQWDAKLEKILGVMQAVPVRLLTSWSTDDKPYYVLLLLTLLWLALALTGRRDESPRASTGYPYRLELIALLSLLGALFLPMHQLKPVDLWMIGGRFVSLTALFAALLPAGPIRGRRMWLLGGVVAISIYYPLALAAHWQKYDRRAASFRRLIRKVPRGSSTLTLVMGDGTDPDCDPQAVPWLMYSSYSQYFSGGFNPWTLSTGFPMIKKPGKELPSPAWKAPSTFRMDEHGVHYDYILIYNEGIDYSMFGPDDSGRAPLVAHDGAWRLYHIRQQ
jgi:hypothetical protein